MLVERGKGLRNNGIQNLCGGVAFSRRMDNSSVVPRVMEHRSVRVRGTGSLWKFSCDCFYFLRK